MLFFEMRSFTLCLHDFQQKRYLREKKDAQKQEIENLGLMNDLSQDIRQYEQSIKKKKRTIPEKKVFGL